MASNNSSHEEISSANNNAAPSSSARPGPGPGPGQPISSAQFLQLLLASRLQAQAEAMREQSSGRIQDLEQGEPSEKEQESENDADQLRVPNGGASAPSQTPSLNQIPTPQGPSRPQPNPNVALLARLLGVNASGNMANGSNPGFAAADEEEEEEEEIDEKVLATMDPDAAAEGFINRIDERFYPRDLVDPKKLLMEFPNTSGALMGMQAAKALAVVLHGPSVAGGSLGHFPVWEHSYYLSYKTNTFPSKWQPLPKEFTQHLFELLKFLNGPHQPKTPDEFLNVWARSKGTTRAQVMDIWDILEFTLLLFSIKPDDPAMAFPDYINSVFPPSKRPREKFSIKLDEILAVGLKVEPVTLLGRHLEIEGRTVYIYKPPNNHMLPLHKYKDSRFATALGISSLGAEVLSSINALYGHSAELTKLAGDLSIKPAPGYPGLFEGLLMVHRVVEPKVLGGRLDALEDLIARERVWWRSLLRDIKKRTEERPFEFWGAVLAALFSVTTIIQTITSIISAIYSIKQYQVSIPPAPTA